MQGGHVPPWIGYLAVEETHPVGTCAFEAALRNNRVEIAYLTLPGSEGRGVATGMTRLLVEIAARTAPGALVAAQTHREEGASAAVLRRNGFRLAVALEYFEAGPGLGVDRETTGWRWKA